MATSCQPQFIAGFIVGMPPGVDMNGQTRIVAYDLACPTCYNASALTKRLTLDLTLPYARCPQCNRLYDLSNKGIIIEGDRGNNLESYSIAYTPAQDAVEMIIRGYLTGSAWRAYKEGCREICGVKLPDGMRENERFPEPIITPTPNAHCRTIHNSQGTEAT